MKIIKRTLQTLFLASILFTAVTILNPTSAKAACSNDYFTGARYCGGHQVLPSQGAPINNAMMVNNADDFIDRLRGFVFDRGTGTRALWGRTGSEFIILSMLGYTEPYPDHDEARRRFGDFERLVRQYNAAGRISWDAWIDYPANFINSRVSPDYYGAGYYVDPSPQSQHTIIFYNPDGTQVLIKKNCANIVGATNGRLWELTGTIQGYKVEVGTKTAHASLSPAIVTATSLATGAPYSASGNPYSIGNILANQNYRVTAQSPPGWKLVGFYYGSGYYPGSSLDIYLNPGATVDIWPAYERLYYPWLQTSQGNVTSLNSIFGQNIGVNGGRTGGALAKEAEFVIIAAASGSSFCSSNAYALGSSQYNSGSWNCSLGQYIPDTKFTNINGIADNIKSIKSDGCIHYPAIGSLSNPSAVPGPDASNGCKHGMIWKSSTGMELTGGTFSSGRATIFVEGDLTITGNIIAHQTSNQPGEFVPNLGIYATGNVTIAETVSQIDATIISQGTIKTCTDNYKIPASSKCTGALVVHGMLASSKFDKSFEFGRRATTTTGGTGSPAESIIYQGKLLSFPPPEFTITKSKFNRTIKYESNLPPRF